MKTVFVMNMITEINTKKRMFYNKICQQALK